MHADAYKRTSGYDLFSKSPTLLVKTPLRGTSSSKKSMGAHFLARGRCVYGLCMGRCNLNRRMGGKHSVSSHRLYCATIRMAGHYLAQCPAFLNYFYWRLPVWSRVQKIAYQNFTQAAQALLEGIQPRHVHAGYQQVYVVGALVGEHGL